MSNIAVFFAEGYEEIEALTVVDILRRAGEQVSMVSVNGEHCVKGSHGIGVNMDTSLGELDFESQDVLVLPGGLKGTQNLEACEPLMKEFDDFFEKEKTIAAICAAPSIFGHRGYLQGKKACSYPSFESHLEGAEVLQQPAVCDGEVITGRGMGASIAFALEILKKLQNQEAADIMAEKIVYTR